jgi:hypothetical protein
VFYVYGSRALIGQEWSGRGESHPATTQSPQNRGKLLRLRSIEWLAFICLAVLPNSPIVRHLEKIKEQVNG